MIQVVITYHATGAQVSFTPGNDNFTYWVYQKVKASRWRKEADKDIADNVSDDEAEYIEQLATAQAATGDQVRLEVIGRPVSMGRPVKNKPEPEPENRQMSLF